MSVYSILSNLKQLIFLDLSNCYNLYCLDTAEFKEKKPLQLTIETASIEPGQSFWEESDDDNGD